MRESRDTPQEPTSTVDSPKLYRRYPPNFGCMGAIPLILGVDIVLAFLIYLLTTRMF